MKVSACLAKVVHWNKDKLDKELIIKNVPVMMVIMILKMNQIQNQKQLLSKMLISKYKKI